MRLQKYMAQSGIASRRAAEGIIAQGRVRVNGVVVDTMGYIVQDGDVVQVDGNSVRPVAQHRYIVLNKPQGIITTSSDPQGRTTVLDLIDLPGRLFPVGRLDYDTEGLILLTDDGEMAQALTHPSQGVEKLYDVKVRGAIGKAALHALTQGVTLDDGHVTAPAKVQLLGREGNFSALNITVHEGHNRLIRRMCDAVGYPVTALARIGFGPLLLGHLKPGKWRNLSTSEMEALQRILKTDE